MASLFSLYDGPDSGVRHLARSELLQFFTLAFAGGLVHGRVSTVLPAIAFILTIYDVIEQKHGTTRTVFSID